jgi:hypothetical protein
MANAFSANALRQARQSRISLRDSRFGLADREPSDPVARFFDDQDRAATQGLRRSCQNRLEPFDDVRGAGILQTEEDHLGGTLSSKCGEVTEVEIERQDDPILGQSFREDLLVERPMEALVPQVNGVMTTATQPLDDVHVHAHVGEELHVPGLRAPDFVACEPGRVLKGLLNVLSLQVRVSLQDLLERRTVGDLPDDHRHGDAHPTDACPAAHDLRIEGDPVEHGVPSCHFPLTTRPPFSLSGPSHDALGVCLQLDGGSSRRMTFLLGKLRVTLCRPETSPPRVG